MPDEIPTYGPGDTVRVELDLEDASGIATVLARFGEVETGGGREGQYFILTGDGGGKTQATVTISGEVPNKILAGEYKCTELSATDVHGNVTYHAPDIRLRIEAPPGDFAGPELTDWRFPD